MQITINSAQYHLQIFGSGSPHWLLLHGFMGSGTDFSQISSYLPGQVVTLDLLGHGQTHSVLTKYRLSFQQQIIDLSQIIMRLQLTRLNLVGYSMGGRIALGLACTYPKLVTRLFLESCTAGINDPVQRQQRQQHDQLLAQRLREESLSEFIDYWQNLPLFQSQKNLPFNLQYQIRQQRQHQNPQALAASLEGMGTGVMPNFWPQLKCLTIPTLLVTGQLDDKFNVITAQMAARIPKAQRTKVRYAGHNVHLEQSQSYLQLLKEFFYAN